MRIELFRQIEHTAAGIMGPIILDVLKEHGGSMDEDALFDRSMIRFDKVMACWLSAETLRAFNAWVGDGCPGRNSDGCPFAGGREMPGGGK